MRWSAAVLAAVLSTAPLTSARAFGDFKSGPWGGEAFFQDARFTHCGMRATLGAWKLVLTLTEKGSVNLGLFNKKLNFTKGNKLQGFIQLDAAAPTEHTFLAIRKDTIGLRMRDPAAVQSFVGARRVRIKIGEVLADFRFGFTREAFAQLSNCVAKRGT